MIDLNKKILITGGSGFIGLNLIRKLTLLGANNIYVFVRKKSDYNKINTISKYIKIFQVSIEDKITTHNIINKIKPEIVYHLAAKGTKGNNSNNDIQSLIEINGIGTINLINEIESINTCEAMVYISTIYEYGANSKKITEKNHINPFNDYALSKSIGTLYAINKGTNNNFPIITYKLSSVYGPGDKNRIIPLILENIAKGIELNLYNMNQKRDYIYIDDVINALLNINIVVNKPGDIINIGSGYSITVKELIEIIKQLYFKNFKKNSIYKNMITNTSMHWEVNNNYMKKRLNIPITPILKGLEKTIEEFKNNL